MSTAASKSKGLVLISGGTAPLPDPPYPSEARSKGWRFELDLERAKASDTWGICPAEIRPWLLMMWAEAWMSVPCGTFSNDDAVIAGRIGMPLNLFRAHRDVLMRGWVLHSDGRLYHHVITERITHLLGFRFSETARIKEWRDKKKQALSGDVTRNVLVSTPVGTGTGTGTGTGKERELPLSHFVDTLSSPPPKGGPPCPVEKIVELWNSIVAAAGGQRALNLSKARREMIIRRWREVAPETLDEGLAWFRDVFTNRIAPSKFMTGRQAGKDGRTYRIGIDVAMRSELQLDQIAEGKYA